MPLTHRIATALLATLTVAACVVIARSALLTALALSAPQVAAW
ncbi:hypothetical protein [Halodurantibacterium flavum]|uniref:Uncharacterized protein n=1 Tax=Halodurantibacterium flavum TaxID=1382802 RepID=A0ABW4S8B5_9RHOB